ncbi:MAG: hypothetical protein JWP72_3955 [Massilia sp.]|nr:hypothetical protein [Massilia sp.]MDB5792816.1 hypothetical protein [Massilia sp.]
MSFDGSVSSVESPGHRKSSRLILAAILATMFVSGLVSGVVEERNIPEPMWWTILSAFLSSFLTFCWFRLDRDARGIRRSVWVNIAILLLEPAAIMVYVLVSRPRGQKLRAFGRLAGFFLLLLLAAMLGMMAAFGVA